MSGKTVAYARIEPRRVKVMPSSAVAEAVVARVLRTASCVVRAEWPSEQSRLRAVAAALAASVPAVAGLEPRDAKQVEMTRPETPADTTDWAI
jgi:hypothetical protein